MQGEKESVKVESVNVKAEEECVKVGDENVKNEGDRGRVYVLKCD